jgi:SAM-dependent methyltransferase
MASSRGARRRTYTPALRFHALTGYFDALMARSVRQARFRQCLLEQLDPEPGQRVIDLGCGTGTLAILLKRRAPEVGSWAYKSWTASRPAPRTSASVCCRQSRAQASKRSRKPGAR